MFPADAGCIPFFLYSQYTPKSVQSKHKYSPIFGYYVNIRITPKGV